MAAVSFAGSMATATAFSAKQQQRPAARRSCGVVFAMAKEEPKLNFEANKRTALGFTESDSAGQTNIFAVEPKQYVAGSNADASAEAVNSTYGAAAIAGTFAVGAVIAGLVLIQDTSNVDLGPTGDFKSLTEYKTQFSSEFATVASAPAVAE